MNATAYFKGTVRAVLGELVDKVVKMHVDMKVFRQTLRELFDNVESVLRCLMGSRPYPAAHKLVLYSRVKICGGKVRAGTSVLHDDLEQIRGLLSRYDHQTLLRS